MATQKDIEKIRNLLTECREDARANGWTGNEYEYTAADLDWVTDELGYKPTLEQWEEAGLGWVGGAHTATVGEQI